MRIDEVGGTMRAGQATPRAHRRLRRAVPAVIWVIAVAQVVGWFTAARRVGHFRNIADRAAYVDAYNESLA